MFPAVFVKAVYKFLFYEVFVRPASIYFQKNLCSEYKFLYHAFLNFLYDLPNLESCSEWLILSSEPFDS